jgi:ribosomal protein S7
MRIAKRSLLAQRIFGKKYKFDYFDVFVRLVLRHGNKRKAVAIVSEFFSKLKIYYRSVSTLKGRTYASPRVRFDLFISSLFDKYRPRISLVDRKVAAKNYSLPWYIDVVRSKLCLVRWFLRSAKERTESVSFSDKLFLEFLDLSKSTGRTFRKLEEYYTVALRNRPFLKFLRRRRKVARSRLKKYSA